MHPSIGVAQERAPFLGACLEKRMIERSTRVHKHNTTHCCLPPCRFCIYIRRFSVHIAARRRYLAVAVKQENEHILRNSIKREAVVPES